MDLGAKVPEAAVLEHKLTKMVKLEPQVQATLAKVNEVMKMPSKAKLEAATTETNKAVKKIEKAVHAEKVDKKAEKEESKVEEKVAKVATKSAEKLEKVVKKTQKKAAAAAVRAGGLVQAN